MFCFVFVFFEFNTCRLKRESAAKLSSRRHYTLHFVLRLLNFTKAVLPVAVSLTGSFFTKNDDIVLKGTHVLRFSWLHVSVGSKWRCITRNKETIFLAHYLTRPHLVSYTFQVLEMARSSNLIIGSTFNSAQGEIFTIGIQILVRTISDFQVRSERIFIDDLMKDFIF